MAKDWGVVVKKKEGSGWRRVSSDGSKNFEKHEAFVLRNKLRKKGRKTKLVHDPEPRNWKVLVLKEDGSGWREASGGGTKRFTKHDALVLRNKLKKRGRTVKARQILSQRQIDYRRIAKWLSGDLDFDRDLMVALSKVAEDIGWRLHVNYGKRTYAEQEALYKKYGPGRAARPGTSRHETGHAADVVSTRFRWMNLGRIPRARAAMAKHGVGLPVRGESWHAEMTPAFNA